MTVSVRTSTLRQAASVNLRLDCESDIVRGLVLPEAQDSPTRILERTPRLAIPLNGCVQLGTPELGIRSGLGPVFRARVPEAPVDEHRDSSGTEHEVSRATQVPHGPGIDSIAQSKPMDGRSHCQLRSGIPTAIRHHRPTRSLRGRPRARTFRHDGVHRVRVRPPQPSASETVRPSSLSSNIRSSPSRPLRATPIAPPGVQQ